VRALRAPQISAPKRLFFALSVVAYVLEMERTAGALTTGDELSGVDPRRCPFPAFVWQKVAPTDKYMGPMNQVRRLLAPTFRIPIAPVLAVLALIGCSAAGDPAGRGSTGSGSTGGVSPSTSGGASPASNGNGAAGDGLNLNVDAGSTPTGDASAGCARLNIGIFGNPGSNSSSNFEQWLTRAGTSVTRIQTTADEPLTGATLVPFDVVVLDCLTRDYSADEVTSFAAWVTTGGGVAAMSGYHDDPTVDWRANSLLAPLGVAFGGERAWGPATTFAMHPITKGLTSVTFTGGYAITDLGGASSVRTAIAFLPSTPARPVSFAIQMGSGRAFLWGDEWIEFDSEWAALPEIPQLWVQAFAWIAPMTACALNPPK
jgi:hypothetical protein